MIRVRISEDALQDLNDGFVFYEAQEAGLGDYFAACLRADIEGLRISGRVDLPTLTPPDMRIQISGSGQVDRGRVPARDPLSVMQPDPLSP